MFERFKEPKKSEEAEVVSRDDEVLKRVQQELKTNPPATPSAESMKLPIEADVNYHPQPTESEQQEFFDKGKRPFGHESL